MTSKNSFNKTDRILKKNQKYPQSNSDKRLAILLFLGSFLLIASLYQTNMNKKQNITTSNFSKSEKFEKLVNKHLMLTNEKIILQRQRMEFENNKNVTEFGSTSPQNGYTPLTEGSNLIMDNQANELANLLGRGERSTIRDSSPDEIIQTEVLNKMKWDEYSKIYREEYAKQFIENARRGDTKSNLTKIIK